MEYLAPPMSALVAIQRRRADWLDSLMVKPDIRSAPIPR